MYKVSIEPHWRIAYGKNQPIDTTQLLRLLEEIQAQGAILQAAKTLNISYRNAWGMLREAESIFNAPLLKKQRGKGTTLTNLATTLLWAERRIAARLSPTLDNLSSELENQLIGSISETSQSIRLYASYGFAVAALMGHINQAHLPVALRYMNGQESATALSQNECELAGFHIPVSAYKTELGKIYSQYLCPQTHCLIHLANLKQGLFVHPNNPKKINDLKDLIRPEIRFINRQAGSGTRRLLEFLLKGKGINHNLINGFEIAEFTHAAIAAFIASNMADTGFGVETAARQFNLDFVPIVDEQYFFAVRKTSLDDKSIREVIKIMQGHEFKQQVNQLGGYSATNSGNILSMEEVFG